MNTCEHNRDRSSCCECRYGKLTFFCKNNKKNKCIITNEHCSVDHEDRWLCDDFVEKETGYFKNVEENNDEE